MATALVAAFIAVALMSIALPVAAAQLDDPGQSQGQARGHVKDVVLVRYERGASKAERGKAAKSVGATKVDKLSKSQPDYVAMKLPPGQTVEWAIEKIERQPGVSLAEPNYLLQATDTSDDTYFVSGQLWGMFGDASTPANLYGSGAAEAWAAGVIGSSDVYVGVIDTGVMIDHPDLAPNIWRNVAEIAGNGADDDGNGYVDDINGWDFFNDNDSVFDGAQDDHGTHVAGTIGARGGNSLGVAGVNWNVKIIPAKFLGADGGSTFGAAQAVQYLTDLKLDQDLNIVASNNSWGCLSAPDCSPSTTLLDAIERGGDADILFMAAAGNNGRNVETKAYYPSSQECTSTALNAIRGWDCIVSVASITLGGDLSSFSNYGDTRVDLGAPGSGVWSTHPDGYASYSGTSMATPHVTGAVALCASLRPTLGASDIRSYLMSSTTPTSSLSGKTVTGGRLDIGSLIGLCYPPVSVPNLVGKLEATALSDLGTAGLGAGTRSTANHASIAAGRVISSDPAAGTSVAPDSLVAYVVSSGPAPVSVLNPKTVVVDDHSSGFTRSGSRWRQSSFGYLKHHYWAPARAASVVRTARWTTNLKPGYYKVLVKVPNARSATQQASYRIKTSNGWVKRQRNQDRRRGDWVSLGNFRLSGKPVVKLVDKTGERGSPRRRVLFDAVKFRPVSAAVASKSRQSATPVDTRSAEAQKVETAATPEPAQQPEPSSEPVPEPTKAPEPPKQPEPTPEPTLEPTPVPTKQPEPAPDPTSQPEATPPSDPDAGSGASSEDSNLS
jgi:subtilisin family serine protease